MSQWDFELTKQDLRLTGVEHFANCKYKLAIKKSLCMNVTTPPTIYFVLPNRRVFSSFQAGKLLQTMQRVVKQSLNGPKGIVISLPQRRNILGKGLGNAPKQYLGG